MLRLTFLALFLLVSSSSSTSMIKKSLSRRQAEPTHCQAIEGFDCKCTYYRVTCTTDNNLPSSLTTYPNEQQKYQSVELVIAAPSDISVNQYTFEPVKQLYKPDSGNLEFRVKFEKFTSLQLSSPGIFNRVFPDNLPSDARKHIALEIYNPEVQPNDNVNLFQNTNVESLELYALYPFRGTFQQLFNGANINYLRLSGGDIRSDISQPFTGNIAKLELAKQASALSVQNFPVYPAHELTINAFYISEFNDPHPPNYNNLGELRVHSPGRIPANAFQNFPNIHTLSLSSDQGIDPQALNGLNNLEKLIVKDTQPSLDLLKSLPNLKEFETSIEKLDEKTQCQLLEKLANGQLAVQAIPNGRECTCVSAYLEVAAGRSPCDAQHCDHSSCAAIKNNYNADTRTFTAPPAILRADGSNAFYPRPARPNTGSFQVSQQDQEKLNEGIPQPQPEPQSHDGSQHGSGDNNQGQDTQNHDYYQPYPTYDQQNNQQSGHDDQYNQNNASPAPQPNSNQDDDGFDYDDSNVKPKPVYPLEPVPSYPESPGKANSEEGFDYDDEAKNAYATSPSPSNPNPPSNDEKDNFDYNDLNVKPKPVYPLEPVPSYSESPGKANSEEVFDYDGDVKNVYTTPPLPSNPNPSSNDEEDKFDYEDSANQNKQKTEPPSEPIESDSDDITTVPNPPIFDDQNNEQGSQEGNQDNGANQGEDGEDGAGAQDPNATLAPAYYPDEDSNTNGTATDISGSNKKKPMSWLPIIIIAAAIVGLLLIGLVVLLIRKNRAKQGGYAPTNTNETAAPTART